MNGQLIIAPPKPEIIILAGEPINKQYLSEEVLYHLHTAGLQAYEHYKASSGSIYIKFNEPHESIGSLRISDHDSTYGYRWNLRLDINTPFVDTSNKWDTYFYPLSHLPQMVRDMWERVNITEDYSKLWGL